MLDDIGTLFAQFVSSLSSDSEVLQASDRFWGGLFECAASNITLELACCRALASCCSLSLRSTINEIDSTKYRD